MWHSSHLKRWQEPNNHIENRGQREQLKNIHSNLSKMKEQIIQLAFYAAIKMLPNATQDTLDYVERQYPKMTAAQAMKHDSAYFTQNAYKIGYSKTDIQQCPFYRRCECIKLLKGKEKLTSKR